VSNEQFYLDRSDDARREAEAATLDNVRDRAQRSSDAWAAMARRAAKTEAFRAVRKAAEGSGTTPVVIDSEDDTGLDLESEDDNDDAVVERAMGPEAD
jgi:hypothetical protein